MKALAAAWLRSFEERERPNGEKYWIVLKPAEGLSDAIRAAHGDFFPEDWKYRFTREALEHLASWDREDVNVEPDLELSALLAWAGSHWHRIGYYTDEAADQWEMEPGAGVACRLERGQKFEKLEVFHAVADVLELWVERKP